MPEALERVSGIIRESASSRSAAVREGVAGLFGGGGKMLRPGLLLLSARFGEIRERHYRLAAALEMLHMATLVHDDVIDDSPVRRGLPAAHVVYGKKDAVLIGDFLLSRCMLLAEGQGGAAAGFARAISTVCEMEIEQDEGRFRCDTSERGYLRKVQGKTALLFSSACFMGAREAGVGIGASLRLRRVGHNIGIAFQITDDVLDYTGDPDRVRKPLGNDIREGLVTMPVLCALRLDRTGSLKKIFSRGSFTAEECAAIFAVVRECGGAEAALKRAGDYTGRALRDIAALPAGESRDMLENLAGRLLTRQG